MLYKFEYISDFGSILQGDCIYATCDEDAFLMATGRAKLRHGELFGLHEVTGMADDGTDLIRPVNF